ncbi:MAG: hypothetical protein PHD48_02385 [Alphaproteobacteria bacterium]|nr:hypothetical protein [Alphaproteobacteria bacterium]
MNWHRPDWKNTSVEDRTSAKTFLETNVREVTGSDVIVTLIGVGFSIDTIAHQKILDNKAYITRVMGLTH